MTKTLGVTHIVPMFLLSTWKFLFCKKGWHLFDEVLSLEDHYLSCDACNFIVGLPND